MRIPGTMVFRCEMSNDKARLADLRNSMPCLLNSLRQGDCAYIHCVSGISRAPLAAAALTAKLLNISFQAAQNLISQVRNVDFEKGGRGYKSMIGPWIRQLQQDRVEGAKAPSGYSCSTTRRGQATIHAIAYSGERAVPICRWGSGESIIQGGKGETLVVEDVEEARQQFGGKFCENCGPLMRASLRLQVRQLWAD